MYTFSGFSEQVDLMEIELVYGSLETFLTEAAHNVINKEKFDVHKSFPILDFEEIEKKEQNQGKQGRQSTFSFMLYYFFNLLFPLCLSVLLHFYQYNQCQ